MSVGLRLLRGVLRVAVIAGVVVVTGCGPGSAGHSSLMKSCSDADPGRLSMRALSASVVQASDLRAGWRVQKLDWLPEKSGDGGDDRRGGAVLVARAPLRPWPQAFGVESVVEAEPSVISACRASKQLVDGLLHAGVGAKADPTVGPLAGRGAMISSSEAVYGPSFMAVWHRGRVVASVQVTYPSSPYRARAKAELMRLALLQDRRLRDILGHIPVTPGRARPVNGIDTGQPTQVAVAWLKAERYRCERHRELSDALSVQPINDPKAPAPCAPNGVPTVRATHVTTFGHTSQVDIEADMPNPDDPLYIVPEGVRLLLQRTPHGWRVQAIVT